MKKHIFKLNITLMAILIAIFSAYALYYVHFRTIIISQYQSLHEASFSDAKNQIENSIDTAFDKLEKWQQDGIMPTAEYDGYGTITSSSIDAIIDNKHQTIAISNKTYQDMLGRYKMRGSDIVTWSAAVFNNEYIIFTSANSLDGEYKALFIKKQRFFATINTTNLDNLIIVEENGIILASAKQQEAASIFSLLDDVHYGNLIAGKSKYMRINKHGDIDSFNAYVIKDNVGKHGITLVGYINGINVDSAIKEQSKVNLIFVIVVAMISFIGTAFVLVLYVTLNNKNLTGRFSRGKYSLIINSYGKILAKNKLFKSEFEYKDIVDCTIERNTDIVNALNNNGDVTLILHNKKGEERYIKFLTARCLIGYRMLGSDVTELMQNCLEAKELAHCDPLTKLPNGSSLHQDYADAMERDSSTQFCMFLLEIKDMERYRTMFGHEVSDSLRLQFAGRLTNLFDGKVYHKGDTRFLVFSQTTKTTEFITKFADKYEAILSAPIAIGTHNYKLTFKGGFSKPFSAAHNVNIDNYIRQATHALHSAMVSGDKHIVGFFDAMLKSDSVVFENRQAVIDLIKNDQIMLHYQPQYCTKSHTIIGFEALTRVKKRLNISISEFIGLAEQNGSIIELGEHVYQSAMEFAKDIKNLNLTISLNVSPVQLMQEGFIEKFIQHYRKQKLRKHSIAVEITETYLMSNYNSVLKNLELLSREGIAVHLDDFGVVYSSMLYLKKLPIRAIKIDREFVKDITVDDYSKMVVNIVATTSRHLKLQCIAEGVETKEQVKVLESLNCDIIQGYYISAAVPPEQAKSLAIEYLEKKRDKK